jgi:hypothetical protein
MTEGILIAIIGVTGTLLGTAVIPQVAKYFQDRSAFKSQLELEKLKYLQGAETRRAEHDRQVGEARLKDLVPTYEAFMHLARSLEGQTIAIGKLSPKAEDFEARLTPLIAGIKEIETAAQKHLKVLDVEPGANLVVGAYHTLASALDELIAALIYQHDHGEPLAHQAEKVAHARNLTTGVRDAITAHIEHLRSGA